MKLFFKATMTFFVALVLFFGAEPCGKDPSQAELATKNGIVSFPRYATHPACILGRASWYGPGFFGRTRADGTPYEATEVFVANKTLPLGTELRIMNLQNRRAVIARVKDRGPYIAGRTLDLSFEAAQRLGAIEPGVVTVAYEVLSTPRRREELAEVRNEEYGQ